MHAISSYRTTTHKATNTQTNRRYQLQYTAPLASAQYNKLRFNCSTSLSENVIFVYGEVQYHTKGRLNLYEVGMNEEWFLSVWATTVRQVVGGVTLNLCAHESFKTTDIGMSTATSVHLTQCIGLWDRLLANRFTFICFFIFQFEKVHFSLQYFDTVGWATGRASGL